MSGRFNMCTYSELRDWDYVCKLEIPAYNSRRSSNVTVVRVNLNLNNCEEFMIVGGITFWRLIYGKAEGCCNTSCIFRRCVCRRCSWNQSERAIWCVFAEIDCWSHAAESLTALSNKYSSPSTLETIERVNRLINAWPPDDTLPAEGYEGVKTISKKLLHGLKDIRLSAEGEVKYEVILLTKPFGAQLLQ